MKAIRLVLQSAVFLSLLAFATQAHSQSASSFVLLHQGYDALSFTKKQIRVITSQTEYVEALAAYSMEDPRQLDFNAGRVLLVDMGRRSTGGFSIGVTGAENVKGGVRVWVQLTKPGPACAVTLSSSNPYQFVYIPTKKEILVSESLATLECE